MNYRIFVAVLVAVSVFLNYTATCAAADVITSGFTVPGDFSTYYDFELCPVDAKVSEIISDTLGSQHTIKWENPKDMPAGYRVEVYAVCDFEIYAPKGMDSASYAALQQATDKEWQTVSTPYVKIYEGDALGDASCIIDFDTLMSFVYKKCVDASYDEDSETTMNIMMFCQIIGDYCSSYLRKPLSEVANIYSYCIGENKCADFRFSKMKYYIRYKKAVEPEEPLQEDGKYHYFLESFKPINKAAGNPSNDFSGLPSGVYVGFTYTGGDEVVPDSGSNRYLSYHVKYEIISPYPICLVSGEKLSNSIDSYFWYNTDGSIRYRPYNTTIRTRTENGIQENNGICPLYVLVNNNGNENKVINPSYGSKWDNIPNLAALDMVANSGTYQTNIPVFAAAFSSAADDYLLTGKLDTEENGNSWFMPGGGYQYGQLLQCTVGFADGGASLDKDGSTTSVIDGNKDTDNGWLKKIYYLLKDTLMNDDGDSWLAKIHKRLEWTNTYLKALIAENTISDLGGFIADFVAEKLDAVVSGFLDVIQLDAISEAGESVTNTAKKKFPFSVLTDYVLIVTEFSAEPVAPCETVRMQFIKKADGSYLVDEDITFDFARFDKIARTTRSACYILFTLGLIPATRKYMQMINGGKL